MKFFKNMDRNKLLYWGLIITFITLYVATAFVSWYHAITFFNIANAVWLSVVLSFVAEIGQASVLFGILLTKNKNNFLPWAIMFILTSLQIIGNVVSSYKYIATSNSMDFIYFQKSILFWIQTPDTEMFKVIIAWISGGILPVVALSMTSLVAQNIQMVTAEEKKGEIPELQELPKEKATLVENAKSDLTYKPSIEDRSSLITFNDDLDNEVENLTPIVNKQFEKDFIEPDKKTADKPLKPKRGWHLKKKFIDSNGDIYSFGKLSLKKAEEPEKLKKA